MAAQHPPEMVDIFNSIANDFLIAITDESLAGEMRYKHPRPQFSYFLPKNDVFCISPCKN